MSRLMSLSLIHLLILGNALYLPAVNSSQSGAVEAITRRMRLSLFSGRAATDAILASRARVSFDSVVSTDARFRRANKQSANI